VGQGGGREQTGQTAPSPKGATAAVTTFGSRLLTVLLTVLVVADGAATADAAATRFAGATALLVEPEHNYNGYDFSISAALQRRGFAVTPGAPNELTDPARLAAYDLVVTNLKRHFTPEQVAGLKAYLAAGGAMYGNWGGMMACPELLAACGVARARSVYIKELTLTDSPLTVGLGEQHWAFPAFVGHVKLKGDGSEMVAFDRLDGIEVARDAAGHCLGSLRAEGAGRCAVLGFCPSNYRFVTDDSREAGVVLDNLLTWLLPRGPRPHPLPQTVEVNLPRGARVTSVSLDGKRLADPPVRTIGSLTAVTVPVTSLAEGKAMAVRVAATLPKGGRHIETWIHDPVASSFICFEPAGAADFLVALHTNVVQPLLRYEGGSCCYLNGIAGDNPRERFAQYQGDLLAEYLKACHAKGIKVVGGLYLDWKRFPTHLKDAPPYVAKGQTPPQPQRGQRVCPLDAGVWAHNLAIIENVLGHYPDLDGLILDDNFEFDHQPCYCSACQAKFAAYCAAQPGRPDPQAAAEAGDATWQAFWKERKLAFCKAVRDACAAHGKPVGGWTGQRGPIAFRGVFDFAGDMVYVEPPSSLAPLWPQVGDFPVVTLLWGMNRTPAGIEGDFAEAIRVGSSIVGFWIAYARVEGATDNPWSLGSRPGPDFMLTPGSLTAIERAFAGAEQVWWEYYRDHLVTGDARFVVTKGTLDANGLSLTIKRLAAPSAARVVGPVTLPTRP
jgi:hypothetical protein